MRKSSTIRSLAVALFVVACIACQEETTAFETRANPTHRVDPVGGGGTIYTGCPDLVVSYVTGHGVTGNEMPYSVTIKNIGNSGATIDYAEKTVQWQGWLSADGITRNVPAGGSTFAPASLGIGQTTQLTLNCTFPTSVNLHDYRYLVGELRVANAVGECNAANNTYVQSPIPL